MLIRPYFRVLDRDDDYLDHAVMQVTFFIVPSTLSMQYKILTKQGKQFAHGYNVGVDID